MIKKPKSAGMRRTKTSKDEFQCDFSTSARKGTDIEHLEEAYFMKIVNPCLDAEQAGIIMSPAFVSKYQKNVLAVHWHPEHIPLELIEKRIEASFPDASNILIIPTQHNSMLEYNGYAGLEIDCYSPEFERKVQLLLHFTAANAEKALQIKKMADETFKYRSKQLFTILNTLASKHGDANLLNAAVKVGVKEPVVDFVRLYAKKMTGFIEKYSGKIRPDFLKNKLIRDYFDELKNIYDSRLIALAQIFIKAVKEEVKSSFSPEFFFKTRDVIAQARKCGAGIVVPHPEQFWPILLAGYDVDGYEVWNPQSRQFTEFIINVVAKQNRDRKNGEKKVLVFMGDDTHLGEKVRKEECRDIEKAAREIGLQTAWDDKNIRAALKAAGISREGVINEYRQRLHHT
jgi:hypothetical protein